MTIYPTAEEVIAAHACLLERFGGSPGLRDAGALASALGRPVDLTRRNFCWLALATVPAAAARALRPQSALPEPRSYYGGFRLALQSWSYRKFSLEQAIGKATELRLQYFELSPAHAEFASLSTGEVREIKRKLLDAGLSVHTYGVLNFQKNERQGLETAFRRAQEFGLQTLVLEPDPALRKDVEQLAERYGVNAAIHNSYEEGGKAHYDSPDAVWQAVQGRSPGCGAAVDTGNYLSAGHDPVAAIEKLKGRILCVHLKDVVRPGVSCTLGQGKVDIPAILKALQTQQYENVVALEYDATPGNPDPGVIASLEYLKKITGGR